MAQDINPSHNDYVCDVIGKCDKQINLIYNSFLNLEFQYIGNSYLSNSWDKVGLVKRILEKGFKVDLHYLELAIQYTLEVIDDFENNPDTSWFKNKVTVNDFQEVYVYLMQAKLKYYNTNEKLNIELIDKYHIQELSCLEEVDSFVTSNRHHQEGEYYCVVYIDNKFYQLKVNFEAHKEYATYELLEIEKPTL